MKLMMIWTLYFKGIKNTNRWNIKAKKKESEKKILCTNSEGILGLCCTLIKLFYPNESGLFQIASSLNDLWTLCESYAKDFCFIW